MALQPREKKLAMIVGVLGGVVLLWLGVGGIIGAFRGRQSQIDALQRDVQQKTNRQMQAAAINEQFYDWGKRSLPRDRELARTLYQSWLVAGLADAKLAGVQVEPGRSTQLAITNPSGGAKREVYTKIPYTVRAQGSPAAIVRWLSAFSQADHLHLIRDLSLQSQAKGSDLQLTAAVEALVLEEADRADKLATTTGARLDAVRAAAESKTILDRNLFAAYVPPIPPKPPAPPAKTPPPPPAFDVAKYTFVTSIVSVDSEPQAWLFVRPTNQLLKLRAGDAVQIGQFNGKLVRIGAAEIEIEHDGKRRRVALGKSLDKGVEVTANAS